MNVSVIQTDLKWENAKANRDILSAKISTLNNVDIVLIPEMFTTGFSMTPEHLAEPAEGETLNWMRQTSRQCDVAIAGSYIVYEDGRYFNRMVFMEPSGKYYKYNKRHLFRMANEHEHYTSGDERIVVSYKNWNILLLVCYDLRFPVWSRNLNNDYDLILVCANWPQSRKHAWQTLLAARAIENQCYVAACNRIGFDGNDIFHSGNSAIYGPKGEILAAVAEGENQIISAMLNIDELNSFREKFPVCLDQDSFSVIND